MPHTNIYSKWSEFVDTYKAGRVLVNLGSGRLHNPLSLKQFDKKALEDYLYLDNGFDATIPRYVFSDETFPIIFSKETMDTIVLLKKFDRYRLPHDACIAEFNDYQQPGIRFFAVCYEKQKQYIWNTFDSKLPFIVVLFALYDFNHAAMQKRIKMDSVLQSMKSSYAVVYPIICDIENVEGDKMEFNLDPESSEEERKAGGVQFRTASTPWLKFEKQDIDTLQINMQTLTREMVKPAGFAVRALTAMMQTKGVAQDLISCKDIVKLNNKRTQKKLSPVPEHRYIRLGHVYTKDGRKISLGNSTGRTVKCHSRAAHIRHQRHGPNNSQVKQILIEACLVNYKSGDIPQTKATVVKV